MEKGTKTNIVDDLIEKTAISLPTTGFQYYSPLFEKGLYSAFFIWKVECCHCQEFGSYLMFKTKPISLTPAGVTTGPSWQQRRLPAPEGEGPQATNLAAKMRSRGIESSSHGRRVTLMGKANKEVFVHQARAQHKRHESCTGRECKHRISQDPRGLAHGMIRKDAPHLFTG